MKKLLFLILCCQISLFGKTNKSCDDLINSQTPPTVDDLHEAHELCKKEQIKELNNKFCDNLITTQSQPSIDALHLACKVCTPNQIDDMHMAKYCKPSSGCQALYDEWISGNNTSQHNLLEIDNKCGF